MSLKARRELLAATAGRYQKASKKEKQTILNEFTASSGYHRKYAIGLLRGYSPDKSSNIGTGRKLRSCKYDAEVCSALELVWVAANRICSKRLVPFLPELVRVMESRGHLQLSADVRQRLLTISASTADRLLYKRRRGVSGGISTTRRGTLIKSQVAIRSFSDWDDMCPGFMEADLVAHCDTSVGGHFIQTLVMTDISTTWTEFAALLFRDQETVLQAIDRIRQQIPFNLLGLDTDNGGEFLNYLLLGYCLRNKITFTRSRAYKKNDQCFVEQKNGALIRKFIGYDRFEGIQACQILSALYTQLRLYVNFFQPSMKLISKERKESRVIKKYDRAQTPYQRLLASGRLSECAKQTMAEQYDQLDPLQLLESIAELQDQLWPLAFMERDATSQIIPNSPNSATALKVSDPDNGFTRLPLENTADLPVSSSDQTARFYRRTRKKRRGVQQKRWWRTRQDPFEEVMEEVERLLENNPYAAAKSLFQELQHRYPGQFPDGQLRSFQRRVKDWRIAQANQQIPTALDIELFYVHEYEEMR